MSDSEPRSSDELADAARRGLQRAGVHLMRAAIEVVEGVSAFLEELGRDASESDATNSENGSESDESQTSE